jgi:MFS family permease
MEIPRTPTTPSGGFSGHPLAIQNTTYLTHETAEDDTKSKRHMRYGLCWKPDCLQIWNNSIGILFWLTFYAFTVGFIIFGTVNANTSSFERRFSLSSQEAGWISCMYDLAAGVFVLPITIYGTRGHKARLLAMAGIIVSMGSFAMLIPHFASGPYQLEEDDQSICKSNETSPIYATPDRSDYTFFYLLLFGQALHGIGSSTLYSVGVVYLDSSIKSDKAPIYYTIFYLGAALGPSTGYLLSGHFLSYYVDFDTVDTNSITA